MLLTLHPDVSMTESEDGIVLLNERTGRYWQLNQTGSTILLGLLDGASAGQVANRLARDYRIPDTRAAADVATLLDELSRASLVSI
jgi:hypothetical protein